MTDRDHGGGLGAFLKACRARLTPEQAGLTPYDNRRRVPGLRREELAQLAGVSPSYYARLEQGQSRHASPQVVDAIATALSLSDTERDHLRALAAASGRTRVRRAAAAEHADPALLELLTAIGDVPALILGRRTDVLAWNPMGHALLAGHLEHAGPTVPGRRPNMSEVVFLDPETRALYADWPAKARAVAGNLRLLAGAHPDDPGLASLIGRLTIASPEFHAMWADQRVRACASAVYDLRHPQVGELTVTQQTLRSIDRPDQSLVTCTTAPGGASATALAMLTHIAYPQIAPEHVREQIPVERAASGIPSSPWHSDCRTCCTCRRGGRTTSTTRAASSPVTTAPAPSSSSNSRPAALRPR